MPVLTLIQGQSTLVDPRSLYADSGWVISGKRATHYPCFPGTMEYIPAFPFENGIQYDITYQVDGYTTGLVRSELGATLGTNHSSAGTFTDTYTFHTGDKIKFYSDGGLSVELMQIAEHVTEIEENNNTFSFNETNNKWTANYSYTPDGMLKFSDRFFSFKNGTLWEHDTNPLRNNFYGVQYSSQITFVVNVDFKLDKLFYNIRLDAKGRWSAPILKTVGSNQFPNGMLSQLKSGNFKLIDGKLRADFLNDINDPNFATITDPVQRRLQALFGGRKLQGGWLIVTLECPDTTMAQISSAEIYYTEVKPSF